MLLDKSNLRLDIGYMRADISPLPTRLLQSHNELFYQEDASQEDANIILLFQDVNYKVKSTSKLLRFLRDLLYVLF